MNLGSPDSTEVPDVKKYLTEFLMDGRVIDYPWIFRKILISGIMYLPGAVGTSAYFMFVVAVTVPEDASCQILRR